MALSQKYRDAKWESDIETGRFDQERAPTRQISVPTPLMALAHVVNRRMRRELEFSLGTAGAIVAMLAPEWRDRLMRKLAGMERIKVENMIGVMRTDVWEQCKEDILAELDRVAVDVRREDAQRDADRERARRVEEGLRQTEHTRDGEGDEDDE